MGGISNHKTLFLPFFSFGKEPSLQLTHRWQVPNLLLKFPKTWSCHQGSDPKLPQPSKAVEICGVTSYFPVGFWSPFWPGGANRQGPGQAEIADFVPPLTFPTENKTFYFSMSFSAGTLCFQSTIRAYQRKNILLILAEIRWRMFKPSLPCSWDQPAHSKTLTAKKKMSM